MEVYRFLYEYICDHFFFRLLLTRESVEAQQLVMDVLKQVMKAAQEQLDSIKKKKLRGITEK